MKKFLSGLCATSLGASFVIAEIASANAAAVFVPQVAPVTTSDIIQVKNPNLDPGHGYYRYRRHYNGGNDFYHQNGNYYYHGHRGYRNYRHGYRNYNGWWFPAGAFIAGAVIGGALSNNAPQASYGNSHVQWCYNRYRSYRAYDNTFQPNYGPRRECNSPY
jgi:hypothetical protein